MNSKDYNPNGDHTDGDQELPGVDASHAEEQSSERSKAYQATWLQVMELRKQYDDTLAQLNALDRLKGLVESAELQRERVLTMRDQERTSLFFNPRLDGALRVYKDLLVTIQGMRFDLGVDQYRGPHQPAMSWKDVQEGISRYQLRREAQLYEAMEAAEEIMDRDGIPTADEIRKASLASRTEK